MKWKALGDRALAVWRFDLARECFRRAGDLSALMLLLITTGDRKGLEGLAAKAGECVGLLLKTQRAPEAALFSRTYAPR